MESRTARPDIGAILRWSFAVGLYLLIAFIPAAELAAQDTGQVIGRVVSAEDEQPMSMVQISVVGTGLGTTSREDGLFRIANIPAGEHQLQFQRLGYAQVQRTVTVAAGEAVRLDVQLEHQALALDELVVTGTAGAARRREIGNTIAQINVDDVLASPVSVDQLLQGQAAGVSVLPSSGMSGSGSQIRLRGNVSVAMGNEPLIYVDGIRVGGGGYPKSGSELLDRDIRGANDAVGALGDINPKDIERVEIIKGSAATTLYGTEAAAGVIQIFTRQGRTGQPLWTLQVDQGADWLQEFGTPGSPYLNLDDYMRTGHTQEYSLSAQGGTEGIRYFLSTSLEDNAGVLPNDSEEQWSMRGNLQFSPAEELQIQWNTSYSRNGITNTPSGNNAQGVVYNAYTEPAGFFTGDDIRQLLEYDITTDINRFISGATATWAPGDRLTNRLTVGFDRADMEQRNLRPFGFVAAPDGIIQTNRYSNEILTVDYVSRFRFTLAEELQTNLSWGGQHISEATQTVLAASRGFPGPGLPTVSSGAEQASGEERLRVINAGLFVQTLFDFRDRYFLTLGLRVDGNSAFGRDFGLQPYPKASFSWVLSDEGFWPQAVGDVKLRAAFGESGRAPGAFDAVRTWNAVGWGGEPALEPLQVGNPDLGPERTREVEVGFDGSFLNDRLQMDFTYYNQNTTDALFPVRQIPSLGFTGSQLENVGELSNRGIELTLNTTPHQSRALSVDLGGSVSTNRSEVLDLGGAAEFSLGQEGWIMEGHPVPVMWAPHVVNADEHAEPIIEMHHFGPNTPTLTVGVNTGLSFENGIRVSALGEYMGGHYIKNRAFRTMAQRRVAPQCAEQGYYEALEAGRTDEVTAFWRVACTPVDVDGRMFIVPADFFKLRTLTFSAPVPFQLPGANSATFTLTGYNLFQWRNGDMLLLDSEMAGNNGMLDPVREIVEAIPPTTRFVASVRMTF